MRGGGGFSLRSLVLHVSAPFDCNSSARCTLHAARTLDDAMVHAQSLAEIYKSCPWRPKPSSARSDGRRRATGRGRHWRKKHCFVLPPCARICRRSSAMAPSLIAASTPDWAVILHARCGQQHRMNPARHGVHIFSLRRAPLAAPRCGEICGGWGEPSRFGEAYSTTWERLGGPPCHRLVSFR
jgi:hypothetical protein